MSIAKDHASWKKDHKQWLANHKKWRTGHKKILSTIRKLEKMVGQHRDEMIILGKYIKDHDKMIKKSKNPKKHSDSMHNKFKKAHINENSRHKVYSKANKEILQISNAIEKAIKRFNHS